MYIFKRYVKITKIYSLVDEHFTDSTENAHVKKMVDDIMHHKLLDMVLDELDDEKKTHVLAHIDNEISHDSLITDLKDWIEDFEAKVEARIKEAEAEILKLI